MNRIPIIQRDMNVLPFMKDLPAIVVDNIVDLSKEDIMEKLANVSCKRREILTLSYWKERILNDSRREI